MPPPPYPQKNQEIIKNLLFYKKNEWGKIYAKTGFNDELGIAHIVGFYEIDGEIFSFGLNLNVKNFEELYKREEILEKYLNFIAQKGRVLK